MKVLLLGSTGQLGIELARSLRPFHTIVLAGRHFGRLAGASGEQIDLEDLEGLRALVRRAEADLVVNAAAYTAVDRAESEREAAFRVNAEAPAAIAEVCRQSDALLVHYSTDYVFDGSASRPYREDDPTSPLGVYGASKLAGEEAIRASGARHLILRTAWVYAAHGKNFLLTMLRLAAERERLGVLADQFGTPTSAALIADETARLLADGMPANGTWHLTASGSTSWHGFATEIFRGAVERGLLAKAPLVDAIATADYPTPARRPASSVLDNRALQAATGRALPDWQVGLGQVLDTLRT